MKTSYGNALTGLQTIDDSIYYFRADGRLLCTDYGTNIYNYNGIDYYYEIGSGKLTALSVLIRVLISFVKLSLISCGVSRCPKKQQTIFIFFITNQC